MTDTLFLMLNPSFEIGYGWWFRLRIITARVSHPSLNSVINHDAALTTLILRIYNVSLPS